MISVLSTTKFEHVPDGICAVMPFSKGDFCLRERSERKQASKWTDRLRQTLRRSVVLTVILCFLSSSTFLSAAETKLNNGPVPSAVPVVTPEEAEKLNDFAIFLTTAPVTIVEGEITERSELPDPEKSDYPNCRFTVHFNGNTIKSGEPCPKELSLIVEGFENYHVLPNNNIKEGDKVLCTIFPFDQLPEDYQSTQQADDLELFLLESYYVISITTIHAYSDNGTIPSSGIFFKDSNSDYISIFERHINPPIPDFIKESYEKTVRNDFEQMLSYLSVYNETTISDINEHFSDAWEKNKANDPPNYNRLGEKYVWREINGSFWCLPVSYNTLLTKPVFLSQETLDCFAALKKACESNGVQLIVSLIPNLYVISARVINNDYRDVIDFQTAVICKQLSEIGVETIYASDAIVKNYNRYPFCFFYPNNGHPSDTAQDVITDILSKRLKRYELSSDLNPSSFSVEIVDHPYGPNNSNCKYPNNCDIGNNLVGESYTCREILYDGLKIPHSKEAHIITIGNSYMQRPANYPDSFPTLLSKKLLSPVDWYRIGGYGPFSDVLIQFLSRPEYFLKNKKALIFCVGTDHVLNASQKGIMLNIAQLDQERCLLNKKRLVKTLTIPSNVDQDLLTNQKLWGPLTNIEKTVLQLDDQGTFIFSQEIDDSFWEKQTGSFLCLIPCTGTSNTTCKLSINGITQTIFCSYKTQNMRFYNLIFKLPVGTKTLSIKFDGEPDSIFAVKNIQLWQ